MLAAITLAPPWCGGQTLFDPPAAAPEPSRVRGIADPYAGVSAPYSGPMGATEAPPASFGDAATASATTVQSAPKVTPEALPIEGSEIIARVDGQVILASDLLWQVNQLIAMARSPVPPEQVPEAQQMLLRQLLMGLIDTKLLYADFRRTVPPEALPKVQQELVKPFEDVEIPRLMSMYKLDDRAALEAALLKSGSSLKDVQRQFVEKTIAGEWLRNKLPKNPPITYEALLAYYQDHLKEYDRPAQARWEELMVRFDRVGGDRAVAWAKICEMGNQVWQQVQANPGVRGPVFGEVARTSSDSHGVTATEGGMQDWTTLGALRCEELNKALATLQVGQMSDGIESELGFHIVRVLERTEAGRVPFTEAQAKIRKLLEDEQRIAARDKVLNEIRTAARVWTAFHGEMNGPRVAELLDEHNKRR